MPNQRGVNTVEDKDMCINLSVQKEKKKYLLSGINRQIQKVRLNANQWGGKGRSWFSLTGLSHSKWEVMLYNGVS